MVLVDVREDIAAGREPFARIMAVVKDLGADEDLELVVPFEPVPLYEAMGARGYTHEGAADEDGTWRVTFRRQA
ncbi:MAG: DUF2249 domain-containing protein [Dehalococcoidia bacterium]|nr:DUF2249 domain-containing protein [Dehalococcoidia bacterium]